MQALTSLNHTIASLSATPSLTPRTADIDLLISLVHRLFLEVFENFENAECKLTHIRLYQRTLQRLAASLPPGKSSQPLLETIQHLLIQMQDQFPSMFDYNEPAMTTPAKLKTLTSTLQKTLQQTNDELVQQIYGSVLTTLQPQRSTWHTLKTAEYLSQNPPQSSHLYHIEECILGCFPSRDICRHLINRYYNDIHAANDPQAEANSILKRINQLSVDHPFLNEHDTIKYHLTHWLNLEVEALTPGAPPAGPTPGRLTPAVTTSLTVTQLAAFLRLLVECRILNAPNQTQLLNIIAAHVSTTNATLVSPQSLRNKYYSTGRPALNNLKDICITLLNHSRKMISGYNL